MKDDAFIVRSNPLILSSPNMQVRQVEVEPVRRVLLFIVLRESLCIPETRPGQSSAGTMLTAVIVV